MEHYYPYDPTSTTVIEDEVQTVVNGAIQLRHIPKQGSIQIAGFVEASSPRNLETNEFYCQYSLNTMYRECNRIIYFNESASGQTVHVTYITVGTVFTADDANEIKAHLDMPHTFNVPTATRTTKGVVKVGEGLEMRGDGVLTCTVSSTSIPTASESIKGGVKVGAGLSMDGDTLNVSIETGGSPFFTKNDFAAATFLNYSDKTWSITPNDYDYSPEQFFRDNNGRPSELGDIVQWMDTGNQGGYAYRTATQWVNMDYTLNPTQGVYWANICPFLTVEDRKKLDALPFRLGTTPIEEEGAMWISE